MEIGLVEIAVAILATWKLAFLIRYERYFEWLRVLARTEFVDENNVAITFWGRVVGCFWCMSLVCGIVVGVIVWLGYWWLLIPLALSGGAMLLQYNNRISRIVEDW